MKKENDCKILIPPVMPESSGIAPIPVPIFSDPNGSYTGRPADPSDRPIQDADDL